MLLWEIITWGDTPYKNVPTLEALLELIKEAAEARGNKLTHARRV